VERNRKEEEDERQVLAGQSTESWRDKKFILANSLPL
jgi:hypothetical protein